MSSENVVYMLAVKYLTDLINRSFVKDYCYINYMLAVYAKSSEKIRRGSSEVVLFRGEAISVNKFHSHLECQGFRIFIHYESLCSNLGFEEYLESQTNGNI